MNRNDLAGLINAYLAAWNEPEAPARAVLLEQAWAEDGAYTDPQSDVVGREALSAVIGGFLSSNPGSRFELDGKIDHHHDHIRFYWTLRLGNGADIRGMDYGRIDDSGQLARIIGFF